MESLKSSLNYISDKLTEVRILLGVLGVVAMLSLVAVYAYGQTNSLEVHFFDVGQGDAIFIEMPDGRQILIDGGPNDKVIEKLNSVMPFWDRSIDMIIATHADADHLTGLVPVLEHYDVDVVLWNGIEAETKTFKMWQELVEEEGAEVLVSKYGMRFVLSDSAFFEILHPYKAGPGPALGRPAPKERGSPRLQSGRQNDYSLVVRFVYGEDSFLFAGDIERQSEYKIISGNDYIESDILKVAHHGSKTSSSELFLEKVNPKIAVVSSGHTNPYGHPHEAILQRLGLYGIKIRRTDEEGDVVLLSNGNSF